jgi:hypothetical protein
VGVIAIMLVMFFNYSLKIKDKNIHLEKQERDHSFRIKELEKKNGNEQHQLDEQGNEIRELKKDKSELKDMVIKLQDRIINCEKNNGKK